MPVLGGLHIEVIKKRHRNNGGDQKKNGEFTQDGRVFKGGQEEYLFIPYFHIVTLTLISHLEKKNFNFLSCAFNSIAYGKEYFH